MPIRINLLAEIQSAEVARRNDPVKRAIWVAAGLIGIMLLWGGYEFSRTMVAKSEYEKQAKVWKDMEPNYSKVSASEQQANQLKKKVDSLARLAASRFLWGSTLNALQSSVVDQVHFMRLSGAHTYAFVEAAPGKKENGKTLPGKPAVAKERITLVIEAKDYGSANDPGYAKLKQSLWNVPYFKTNLLASEAIILRNFNPQAVPDADGKPFTSFILECQFPEKERRDE